MILSSGQNIVNNTWCLKMLILKNPSRQNFVSAACRHVDANSKNVFGQPRLRASLRDLRSPRRTYKSTIEDDLKKLIIMDSPGETPQRDPVRNLSGKPGLRQFVHHEPIFFTSLFLVSKATAAAHLFWRVSVQRAPRGQLRQLWWPGDPQWRPLHIYAAHTQTRHLQPDSSQKEWVELRDVIDSLYLCLIAHRSRFPLSASVSLRAVSHRSPR